MKTILFDTDVLIDLLRGKALTREQVSPLIGGAYLMCSVITVGELFAGMFPEEKTATETLIQSLVRMPVTEEIARLAGELRNKEKRLELLDCLIAATAISLDAELLTKNIKHYPMKGLQVRQIV